MEKEKKVEQKETSKRFSKDIYRKKKETETFVRDIKRVFA